MTRRSSLPSARFSARSRRSTSVGALVAASVVVGAAIAAGLVSPSAATAAPADSCNGSAVTAVYVGGGVFEASAKAPCTVNLSSFTFVEPDFSPGPQDDIDGHPQTVYRSEQVVLQTTAQTFSVEIPACGAYQADLYVGAPQTDLPTGSLGSAYIAGDVDSAGECTTGGVDGTPTPSPTPSTPPVSASPTPSATPEPTPSTDPTTASPSPSLPAAGTPTPTTSPVAASPAASAPTAVAPSASAGPSLAMTGTDGRMIGAGIVSAAALLAAGFVLLLIRRRRTTD